MSANRDVAHYINNIDKVIRLSGIVYPVNGYAMPIPTGQPDSTSAIGIQRINSNIRFSCGSNASAWSSVPSWVMMEYTCTDR